MRFIETELKGTWLLEPEPNCDERGYFVRTFCELEFAKHGLATRFVQHSASVSVTRGTLRGLHFQRSPYTEVKVVSCRTGAVFDVVVDLRLGSPTCGQWVGFELSAANRRQLYIPAGFAHGMQTLTDNAEVSYLISAFHNAAAADGVRYDDPMLGVAWPIAVTVVSDRDRMWPAFRPMTMPDGANATVD